MIINYHKNKRQQPFLKFLSMENEMRETNNVYNFFRKMEILEDY